MSQWTHPHTHLFRLQFGKSKAGHRGLWVLHGAQGWCQLSWPGPQSQAYGQGKVPDGGSSLPPAQSHSLVPSLQMSPAAPGASLTDLEWLA